MQNIVLFINVDYCPLYQCRLVSTSSMETIVHFINADYCRLHQCRLLATSSMQKSGHLMQISFNLLQFFTHHLAPIYSNSMSLHCNLLHCLLARLSNQNQFNLLHCYPLLFLRACFFNFLFFEISFLITHFFPHH